MKTLAKKIIIMSLVITSGFSAIAISRTKAGPPPGSSFETRDQLSQNGCIFPGFAPDPNTGITPVISRVKNSVTNVRGITHNQGIIVGCYAYSSTDTMKIFMKYANNPDFTSPIITEQYDIVAQTEGDGISFTLSNLTELTTYYYRMCGIINGIERCAPGSRNFITLKAPVIPVITSSSSGGSGGESSRRRFYYQGVFVGNTREDFLAYANSKGDTSYGYAANYKAPSITDSNKINKYTTSLLEKFNAITDEEVDAIIAALDEEDQQEDITPIVINKKKKTVVQYIPYDNVSSLSNKGGNSQNGGIGYKATALDATSKIALYNQGGTLKMKQDIPRIDAAASVSTPFFPQNDFEWIIAALVAGVLLILVRRTIPEYQRT